MADKFQLKALITGVDKLSPTLTGTHYYATSMPKPPAWVKGAKLTLTLGRHLFYKDVP